jgi:hypothetical protein
VSETVLVEGRPRSIYEALGDPDVAPALTDQGVFPQARRVMRVPEMIVTRLSALFPQRR